MKPANIQQPTSNTQHPVTQKRPAIGCWMLVVGCWMFLRSFPFVVCLQLWVAGDVANAQPSDTGTGKDKSLPQAAAVYFPPPESKGGWRKLEDPQEIRRLGGMD